VLEPRRHRHRMTSDKSLTTVYLGSAGRCILIMFNIHRSLWLVSMHGELKWLSGGTSRQAGLLSRATGSNSCRKNIRLSKLSPDRTLYRKAGYSFFLSTWRSLENREKIVFIVSFLIREHLKSKERVKLNKRLLMTLP
jgi:hypothetical protein